MNFFLLFFSVIIYNFLPGIFNLIFSLCLKKKSYDSEWIVYRQIRFILFWQGLVGCITLLIFLYFTGHSSVVFSLFSMPFVLEWHIVWKMILLISLMQWGAYWERKLTKKSKDHIQLPWHKNNKILPNRCYYILFFVNMMLLVPSIEEFIFRYLFLVYINDFPIFYLFLSSVLFSYVHRKNYITYFLFGFLLGCNLLLNNNFWECILIHIANNIWVETSFRWKTRSLQPSTPNVP